MSPYDRAVQRAETKALAAMGGHPNVVDFHACYGAEEDGEAVAGALWCALVRLRVLPHAGRRLAPHSAHGMCFPAVNKTQVSPGE